MEVLQRAWPKSLAKIGHNKAFFTVLYLFVIYVMPYIEIHH